MKKLCAIRKFMLGAVCASSIFGSVGLASLAQAAPEHASRSHSSHTNNGPGPVIPRGPFTPPHGPGPVIIGGGIPTHQIHPPYFNSYPPHGDHTPHLPYFNSYPPNGKH